MRISAGSVTVHHAIGCVRPAEMDWLARQRAESPLVLLAHHYPLDAPQFTWTPLRPDFTSRFSRLLATVVKEVTVPMAIVRRIGRGSGQPQLLPACGWSSVATYIARDSTGTRESRSP